MTSLGLYHFIDNAIIHGLLGGHEEVPIAIGLDFILGLTAVLGNVRIEHLAYE